MSAFFRDNGRARLVLGAILVILIIGGSYLLLYYCTSLNIQQRIETTGTIANVALTLALVALYRRVVDVQQHQRKIMGNQETIMEVQHKPELIISKWSLQADGICLELSNIGDGFAKDLSLITYIKSLNNLPHGQPEIFDIDEEVALFNATEIEQRAGRRHQLKNSLLPGEKSIQFCGPTDVQTLSVAGLEAGTKGGGTTHGKANTELQLGKWGIGDFLIGQVFLLYCDKMGNPDAIPLGWFSSEVNNEVMTVEDMIMGESSRRGGFGNRDPIRNEPLSS